MWFSGFGFNGGGDGYIAKMDFYSSIKYLLAVEFSVITIIKSLET